MAGQSDSNLKPSGKYPECSDLIGPNEGTLVLSRTETWVSDDSHYVISEYWVELEDYR